MLREHVMGTVNLQQVYRGYQYWPSGQDGLTWNGDYRGFAVHVRNCTAG